MVHRYYVVDVFAERPYAGNQLAVVLDTAGLSDETMQQIAAEMNFSETTFVAPERQADGGYRVRIFTPARELDFAGHPVLGTAWVIRHHLSRDTGDSVLLDLATLQVRVGFEPGDPPLGELAWFVGPPARLGATCARERIAAALGISPDEIDPSAPVQQVSAAASAVFVPLKSLEALRRSRLDLQAYAPIAAEGFPPLVYLFCRESADARNDLSARFFFEARGVREDPATGFGAALLGTYLLEHRLVAGPGLSLRIEQGREIGRPSVIRLRARMNDGVREVSVGGLVIPTMRGELLQTGSDAP
jgi:trans-2,3-dihydro-3-hydroxyanthranilate isomerase